MIFNVMYLRNLSSQEKTPNNFVLKPSHLKLRKGIIQNVINNLNACSFNHYQRTILLKMCG